jgi:hypothetical protein
VDVQSSEGTNDGIFLYASASEIGHGPVQDGASLSLHRLRGTARDEALASRRDVLLHFQPLRIVECTELFRRLLTASINDRIDRTLHSTRADDRDDTDCHNDDASTA